jgi:hypothetical protein
VPKKAAKPFRKVNSIIGRWIMGIGGSGPYPNSVGKTSIERAEGLLMTLREEGYKVVPKRRLREKMDARKEAQRAS